MGKDRKRPYTCQEPWVCEFALVARCTCRCDGALHGLKRTQDLSSLPLDDPHQADRQGKLDLGGKHVS